MFLIYSEYESSHDSATKDSWTRAFRSPSLKVLLSEYFRSGKNNDPVFKVSVFEVRGSVLKEVNRNVGFYFFFFTIMKVLKFKHTSYFVVIPCIIWKLNWVVIIKELKVKVVTIASIKNISHFFSSTSVHLNVYYMLSFVGTARWEPAIRKPCMTVEEV